MEDKWVTFPRPRESGCPDSHYIVCIGRRALLDCFVPDLVKAVSGSAGYYNITTETSSVPVLFVVVDLLLFCVSYFGYIGVCRPRVDNVLYDFIITIHCLLRGKNN